MARRALLLLASAALACHGGTSNGPPGSEAGPPGDGVQLGDGRVFKPCAPPCVPPQVCSAAGVCVAKGTCASDLDCTLPMVCDPVSRICVAPKDCGNQQVQAGVVPPNVLLVLDRSCSMTNQVGTLTKWQIAVAALDKLLTSYAGAIRFGLILFPDITGQSCTQDQIPFPVGPGNAPKIQTVLKNALLKTDPYFPDGPCVTNIDTAMQQAATDPGLVDPTRSNFIVLITDGKQAGCNAAGGDSGTTKIIQDLYQQKKVATFVIGFGAGVDGAQLDVFAAAGGRPSSDPTHKFYKAEDQQSLDAALAGIAGQAFGCVLKLSQVPPDPGKLLVFFDGQGLARDPSHQGGWDYDAATNQITFYGSACQDLTAGKVKKLDIIYGCKAGVGDGGIKLDGATANCPPDITKCATQADCPDKTKCVSGCCAKIIQ